jgi:carboxypeptidase Taq
MKISYKSYEDHCKKVADIGHSIALLHWDQEVYMPKGGASFRARQIATLSGIAHDLSTSEEFGDMLATLLSSNSLDTQQLKNVELSLESYKRSKKLNTEFVIEGAKLQSVAFQTWIKAREENDYNIFFPALDDFIGYKKREAEIRTYANHPYDALLDLYEKGANVKQLDPVFADIKKQLVEFINEISKADQIDFSFLKGHFDKDIQWKYGLDLLKKMGYDFNCGRQDISEHPFTISFSPQDVRVTTRIDEQDFQNMTWSCIHEGGHALYEQGLDPQYYGTPLGAAVSLGIHESQSRLWENNVGRSLSFWEANYKNLQEAFSKQFKHIDLRTFYKAINKIEAGLIRTEADELNYHLHVLIRYELEKDLISGNLKVKDLRDAWNNKYYNYFNLKVPDDKQGILQDIHWAHGSFGYFPTYSMGSIYAAQFYAQAEKDIPGLDNHIKNGNYKILLDWLRTNIHQHGQMYTADELCRRITGEGISFGSFMKYAKEKFGEIYDLH